MNARNTTVSHSGNWNDPILFKKYCQCHCHMDICCYLNMSYMLRNVLMQDLTLGFY